jgi:GNAT superfamily N-acetyltransferase
MTIEFTSLAEEHIDDAIALVQADLEREAQHVPALAKVDVAPLLASQVADIVRDGIGGVAATENGRLIGYLVFHKPFDHFFGNTPGAWSPLHAHALSGDDRERLWSLLFQHAAEPLVAQGVVGLSITTWAHDEGTRGLLLNSFGIRLADGIRDLSTPMPQQSHAGIIFSEVLHTDLAAISPLENALIRHLRSSPIYLPARESTEEAFLARQQELGARFFGAWSGDILIGYVKVTEDGETFLSESPAMQNISGAYLEPAYRGRGIYDGLVAFTADTLRSEGATLLGVDCETMNPNAYRFWGKYFDNYTYSWVRRIDERILDSLS